MRLGRALLFRDMVLTRFGWTWKDPRCSWCSGRGGSLFQSGSGIDTKPCRRCYGSGWRPPVPTYRKAWQWQNG